MDLANPSRSLTDAESALIRALLVRVGADTPERLAEIRSAKVSPMEDGGMGSLQFASEDEDRVLGGTLSEASAHDADGIQLVFGLLIDQRGNIYELDVWKVDSSPLIRLPSPSDLNDFQPAIERNR